MDQVQPAHAAAVDAANNAGAGDVSVLKVIERIRGAGGYRQREHCAVGEDGAGTASGARIKALAAEDQLVRFQSSPVQLSVPRQSSIDVG